MNSSEKFYFDVGAEQHFKFEMDATLYDLSSASFLSFAKRFYIKQFFQPSLVFEVSTNALKKRLRKEVISQKYTYTLVITS